MSRGGKRAGAGRPKKQELVQPVSCRMPSQAHRDLFFALGGSKFLHQMIEQQGDNTLPTIYSNTSVTIQLPSAEHLAAFKDLAIADLIAALIDGHLASET